MRLTSQVQCVSAKAGENHRSEKAEFSYCLNHCGRPEHGTPLNYLVPGKTTSDFSLLSLLFLHSLRRAVLPFFGTTHVS